LSVVPLLMKTSLDCVPTRDRLPGLVLHPETSPYWLASAPSTMLAPLTRNSGHSGGVECCRLYSVARVRSARSKYRRRSPYLHDWGMPLANRLREFSILLVNRWSKTRPGQTRNFERWPVPRPPSPPRSQLSNLRRPCRRTYRSRCAELLPRLARALENGSGVLAIADFLRFRRRLPEKRQGTNAGRRCASRPWLVRRSCLVMATRLQR
jgi:hypothetical protein